MELLAITRGYSRLLASLELIPFTWKSGFEILDLHQKLDFSYMYLAYIARCHRLK
jgi:hypothetical protein